VTASSGSGSAGPSPAPALIADAMLGGLARWLRVLGLDVAYDPALDDAALVRLAAGEGRVILTRDRRLVLRRLARNHLLVASGEVGAQLRQVLAELAIAPDPARLLSRCLRCNLPLVPLAAEQARERVPPYVASTRERFRECPRCGRVYWSATHVERMRERLARFGVPLPG
jgi:uncharacterized protein with PIN domain